MMNVTPTANINAGDEEIAIRARLRTEKKRGSITVKKVISTNRTISGAHLRRASLEIWPLTGASDGLFGWKGKGGGHRARPPAGVYLYMIWTPAGPQKSFQS